MLSECLPSSQSSSPMTCFRIISLCKIQLSKNYIVQQLYYSEITNGFDPNVYVPRYCKTCSFLFIILTCLLASVMCIYIWHAYSLPCRLIVLLNHVFMMYLPTYILKSPTKISTWKLIYKMRILRTCFFSLTDRYI